MDKIYWLKQTPEKPAFPDLLWSRPQNRMSAGKLLIIGGNLHSFAAVGEAYNNAEKAGAGNIRIILPSSLKKTVGKIFPAAEFASSTPSGSFSQEALGIVLENCGWANAVLVAGDLGRNAETAILLESLLQKSSLPITLTQDSVDYISSTPQVASNRTGTLLVLSLSQLQRLVTALKYERAIMFSMDLIRLTDWLHEFSARYALMIAVEHLDVIYIAVRGQVSTSKLTGKSTIWRVKTAAFAATWWMQNNERPFDALTTAIAALNS